MFNAISAPMLRPDPVTSSPPKSKPEKSFLRRFECFIVYFIGKHKTGTENGKIESNRHIPNSSKAHNRKRKPPEKATHRKTAGIFYHFENRTHPEQIVKSRKNLRRIFGNFKMEILDILGRGTGVSKNLAIIFERKFFKISNT